ncbi:MAG TPA: hypothetical protein VFE90_17450 [Myxococcales bacterium]|nr:hypothetical protein [Myxococcales bacterium]
MPPAPGVSGPAWLGFGNGAQHVANSAIATQQFTRIRWLAPVDLDPQYTDGELLVHYGSPAITSNNTVVFPVKQDAGGRFRIEARSGTNGGLLWADSSAYVAPAHDWLPPYSFTIDASNKLYAVDAGGLLDVWDGVDTAHPTRLSYRFYGSINDPTVFADTPVTVDGAGNAYFGFLLSGASTLPGGGIARVSAAGAGTWVTASTISNDATITQAAMNSAPALSPDGSTLYVVVDSRDHANAYLIALDSATLAVKARVLLVDPVTGAPATVDDNASSSPTVGPDGDVYYGVIESAPGAHGDRGWLLHFSPDLSASFPPGGFGWDDTASIVPASMVPSYAGPSKYLVTTKYNNYAGGLNRMAVLDPHDSQPDDISTARVMKEVLVIGASREFCINTAAVDPATKSILVGNEDGNLYRWDLTSNTFTQRLSLTSGLGQAYTPTVVGADGAVYAISNAVLFSIGN